MLLLINKLTRSRCQAVSCTSLVRLPSFDPSPASLTLRKAHSRFQNFHGEGCARLERDVSVHGRSTTHRTWLVKTLSPILFSAPDVHLKLLRKMYVDGIMKLAVWETSVKHMNEEWQEFILFVSRTRKYPMDEGADLIRRLSCSMQM